MAPRLALLTPFAHPSVRGNSVTVTRIARGLRELTPDKRRQIYYQIQDLALRDSPLIWLYYAPYTITINKKMKGLVQMATGPWIFKDVTVGE